MSDKKQKPQDFMIEHKVYLPGLGEMPFYTKPEVPIGKKELFNVDNIPDNWSRADQLCYALSRNLPEYYRKKVAGYLSYVFVQKKQLKLDLEQMREKQGMPIPEEISKTLKETWMLDIVLPSKITVKGDVLTGRLELAFDPCLDYEIQSTGTDSKFSIYVKGIVKSAILEAKGFYFEVIEMGGFSENTEGDIRKTIVRTGYKRPTLSMRSVNMMPYPFLGTLDIPMLWMTTKTATATFQVKDSTELRKKAVAYAINKYAVPEMIKAMKEIEPPKETGIKSFFSF